ncbi:MAG: trigger factor [Clostridiales bacterium]|nr:trigger factor [Clostridiales bacterium]
MTTYEKIASNKAKLTFVVPGEEFEAAMNKAYLQNRGKINVPGFRKGKAPRMVIENMYGKFVFVEDAMDIVFPEMYEAAIKENELKPVDRPEMTDMGEYKPGQDMTFTVEVFVRPDVTLGEYKNLTVEVAPKHEVDEVEVEERIKQDQQKGARTIEVTDRTVDYNDTVNLDYAGTVDGVAFEGGTAQAQTLTIGSGQFIPGFEEQMVGMAIGEEKDLQVKFPEQYHSEQLAGADAVFHVKVNSITVTELPELDDDFAQDNGFDTFDAYKADVEKQLNERAETNYNVTIENALIEAAVANAEADIPEAMIAEQTNYILRDMEYRMMYQGLRMEDYLKYTGQTREALAEQYKGEAEKRVKIELVLEAIRKAEGLEPTEEEVDEQTAKQAERMGQELEAFKAGLTDEQRSYLTDTAAIQKVCDLLKAGATVNVKAEAEDEDAE